MTQKTKLEIIGEYRKDHPGPFCSRNRSKITVHSVRGEYAFVTVEGDETPSIIDVSSVFCAREVPVAREFWIVGGLVFLDEKGAKRIRDNAMRRSEIIHVREVVLGEGA